MKKDRTRHRRSFGDVVGIVIATWTSLGVGSVFAAGLIWDAESAGYVAVLLVFPIWLGGMVVVGIAAALWKLAQWDGGIR